MDSLIAFEIYRTEKITFGDRNLTARFLCRKDHEEFMISVIDETSGQVWSGHYDAETAVDFSKQNGESLASMVLDCVKADIADGIGHD